MILVVDVGNTNITFGVYESSKTPVSSADNFSGAFMHQKINHNISLDGKNTADFRRVWRIDYGIVVKKSCLYEGH